MADLQKKTTQGLLWSGIDSYGIYIIKFGFSIAIARILDPKDYGLLGMMAIFLAFGQMITDGGFQASILQKKEPEPRDYSSVFVLKVLISSLIFLLLFLSAPLIADFYREPRLVLITKVLSLGLVIGSFGGIQRTWFIKTMKFRSIAIINLFSSLASGGVGLTIALGGYGVWALIFQTLSGNLFNTISYWIFSTYKIPFYLSWNALKELYSFGWKMFLQTFLNTMFTNIYYPLIGRYFDVVSLGYYTSARRFQQLTISQTNGAISKVLFPAFASIQNDRAKLSMASKKSVRLLIFVMYPVISILIITAHPFVSFFLTDKWLPAVPLMQILYLSGFISPITGRNLNTLNAIGESGITLKTHIMYYSLLIVSIFIGINFQINGLLIASLVAQFIIYFISTIYFNRYVDYKLGDQLKDILITLFISGTAFFITQFVFSGIKCHELLLITFQSLSILSLYYFFMKIIKPENYIEFKTLITPHIPKRVARII